MKRPIASAASVANRANKASEELQRRLFIALCEQSGLPAPTPEHRFAAPRQWRFDYAWTDHRVALEVEGGVWTGGRHVRGKGMIEDMEKYNAATLRNWRLLRVTPSQLCTAETIDMLRAALSQGRAA